MTRVYGWGAAGAQGGSMEQGVAENTPESWEKPKTQEDEVRELREMLADDRENAAV